MKQSVALRNAALIAKAAEIGAAALLRIYTGAPPTSPSEAATGMLLSEHVCGAPFAASVTGGVLTANTIEDAEAVASGTAGWFRIVKADGTTACLDGTVGTENADLITPNPIIVEGQPVSITLLTWAEPNG